MTLSMRKKIAPYFLALAAILPAPLSFADEAAPPPATSQQTNPFLFQPPGTMSFSSLMKASGNDNEKPVEEMNIKELLKEYDGDHKKAWKVYEFFQLRQVYLDGEVNESSANKLINEIDVLETLNPGKQITVIINSGGGSVYDGLRIYNKFKSVKSPIHTVGNNMAASMAAVLLIAGDTREATSTCRILIHEVSSGARGKSTDMKADLRHTLDLQEDLYEIIAVSTGLSLKDIRKLCERDIFYSAEDSVRLGFIDKISTEKPAPKVAANSRKVPKELYPAEYMDIIPGAPSRPRP